MPDAVTDAVMRQAGLVDDVFVNAASTATVLPLRAGPVYAIHAAYKNGTAIVSPTNYTWATYANYVTLTSAPAVADGFFFTVQKRSSAYIADVVNRSIETVLRALAPHYGDIDAEDPPDLEGSPSVTEIIRGLAIGQFKQDLSQGVAMDSAFYRSGRDLYLDSMAALRRIQRGEEGIYTAAGAEIERLAGSLAGGRLHPDGDFVNRLGLADRAQQHTGLYLTLTPDPILTSTRPERGFII